MSAPRAQYTWYQGKSLNSYYRLNAKGDKVYSAKGAPAPAGFIPYAESAPPKSKPMTVPQASKRNLVPPSLDGSEPDTPGDIPSPEPLTRQSRASAPKETDECTAEQELEALEEAHEHLCKQLDLVESRMKELELELSNEHGQGSSGAPSRGV